MTRRKTQRQPVPALSERLGSDPTTIRNEYARPSAGALPTRVRGLPPVEERADLAGSVRFALQRGDTPVGLELIGKSVWRMVYRAIYADGVFDRAARYRLIVAPGGRNEAVRMLQQLEHGFAERIILYEAETLA